MVVRGERWEGGQERRKGGKGEKKGTGEAIGWKGGEEGDRRSDRVERERRRGQEKR